MESLKDKIKAVEVQEIMNALNECDWVMARAARRLGITERMICYKIKKYGIRKEGGRFEKADIGDHVNRQS